MNEDQKYGTVVMLTSALGILLVLMISSYWIPQLGFFENLLNNLELNLIPIRSDAEVVPYGYRCGDFTCYDLIRIPTKYAVFALILFGAYGLTTYLSITPAFRPWKRKIIE